MGSKFRDNYYLELSEIIEKNDFQYELELSHFDKYQQIRDNLFLKFIMKEIRHDLASPLTSISIYLDYIESVVTNKIQGNPTEFEQFDNSISSIKSEVFRIKDYLEDFKNGSKIYGEMELTSNQFYGMIWKLQNFGNSKIRILINELYPIDKIRSNVLLIINLFISLYHDQAFDFRIQIGIDELRLIFPNNYHPEYFLTSNQKLKNTSPDIFILRNYLIKENLEFKDNDGYSTLQILR